jgi:hypothetical protein
MFSILLVVLHSSFFCSFIVTMAYFPSTSFHSYLPHYFLTLLDDWEIGVQFSKEARDFFSSTASRPTLGAPHPHPVGFRGKALGREADHSAPFSAKVMNAWSCTSTSHIFMSSCLIKHKDNFIVTFSAFPIFSSGFSSSSEFSLSTSFTDLSFSCVILL